MKKLNEYKVSENIINKRIKELAFNITKKIFSAINLKTFELNNELEIYYNFKTNEFYKYKPVFINFDGKDLIIKIVSNKDIHILGRYEFLDNFLIHRITINTYYINGEIDLDIDDNINYKKTYLSRLYRTVFHELRHYFDQIENINKTSNKYLHNLHKSYDNEKEIIKQLTLVIDKSMIYYLSDQEIRANTINFYVFGRCKADYSKTNIYAVYQDIENILTNNEYELYKNIDDVVYNDGITRYLLDSLKPIFNNIKDNQITNDFNKLYSYVELKDYKRISFILKKIFKNYWGFLKIQLTKAKFTFEKYYKMGIRNEKFK